MSVFWFGIVFKFLKRYSMTSSWLDSWRMIPSLSLFLSLSLSQLRVCAMGGTFSAFFHRKIQSGNRHLVANININSVTVGFVKHRLIKTIAINCEFEDVWGVTSRVVSTGTHWRQCSRTRIRSRKIIHHYFLTFSFSNGILNSRYF